MTRTWLVIAAVAALTVVADVAGRHAAHVELWWHATPGFDLVYGFACCVAIVVISKAVGKRWLQQPETYWEEDRR